MRKIECGFALDPDGVEHWDRDVIWARQHVDFGAAEDQAICTLGYQPIGVGQIIFGARDFRAGFLQRNGGFSVGVEGGAGGGDLRISVNFTMRTAPEFSPGGIRTASGSGSKTPLKKTQNADVFEAPERRVITAIKAIAGPGTAIKRDTVRENSVICLLLGE
ncbi:hypothetical protein [Cypionkella sp.]|uniref:hypothetical protein n=1 Tax=Cypionkella sp. TaxID=2811411 RepID=UPI00271B6BEA|nr:hypothetical protein [Cypionkella sp.]MDO8985606.1 hypothetical protein [Cypionkella sp.]MDP2048728.1 hypothetical protein [Cypionkella sp.]